MAMIWLEQCMQKLVHGEHRILKQSFQPYVIHFVKRKMYYYSSCKAVDLFRTILVTRDFSICKLVSCDIDMHIQGSPAIY